MCEPVLCIKKVATGFIFATKTALRASGYDAYLRNPLISWHATLTNNVRLGICKTFHWLCYVDVLEAGDVILAEPAVCNLHPL